MLVSVERNMPIAESANLGTLVPAALRQDILDAEEIHYAQVFRASAIMCRRALQLAFQEPPHSIEDGPYSRMLTKLMAKDPPPLSSGSHGLASSIGDYGGIGAHNPQPVSSEESRSAIFTAVKVLNELFSPPKT